MVSLIKLLHKIPYEVFPDGRQMSYLLPGTRSPFYFHVTEWVSSEMKIRQKRSCLSRCIEETGYNSNLLCLQAIMVNN